MKKFVYIVVLSLLCTTLVVAQGSTELPQVSRTYAFTNITIIQSPGRKIDAGTIIIKSGILAGVGKNIAIPPDAIIIKADSLYAYAGFIDGLCPAGVGPRQIEQQEKMIDPASPPSGMAGMTPYVEVRSMLNPDDKNIEQLRNLGFTTAQVVPGGNFLPGQSALILLGGASADKMLLENRSALYSDLTGTRGIYPSTVMGIMAKWRELYRQSTLAKSYDQLYAANPGGLVRPDANRVLEAFYPVIDQRMPVLFKSEKPVDIQRVLSLKSDLGFSLIMADVKDGAPVITKVKASGAKVFLSLDLPEEKKVISAKEKPKTVEGIEKEDLEKRKAEAVARCTAQAAAFQRGGVAFGFCSYSAKTKDIMANLRRMVAAGLTEDDALAALTTTPAKFFGLSDRMGTLDPGKMANLVITDKSYFQENARVQYVVVDGVVYPVDGGKAGIKIEGGWSLAVQTSRGVMKDRLTIRKAEHGYTGTYFSEMLQAPVDLKEITLSGNKLSYKYMIGTAPDASELTADVVLTGRAFKGVINGARFKNMVVEGTHDPKN